MYWQRSHVKTKKIYKNIKSACDLKIPMRQNDVTLFELYSKNKLVNKSKSFVPLNLNAVNATIKENCYKIQTGFEI